MMKTKRFLGILLTITMVMSLIPAFSFTASAEDEPITDPVTETVSYIERSWDGSKVVSATKTVTATVVESTDSDFEWYGEYSSDPNRLKWFVVKDDVTINGNINIKKNVALILCDGATMTVNGCMNVTKTSKWGNDRLDIYCQSAGTGTLKVVTPLEYSSSAIGGNVTIYGGNVDAIIGKGNGGSSSGTLKNGNGDVVLHTFTIDGLSEETPVTAIGGVNYNCTDMKTLDTNKVYAYLPADANPTDITVGGITYELICKSDRNYHTTHSYTVGTCTQKGVCQHCGDENGHYDYNVHTCSGESYQPNGTNDTHGVYHGCGNGFIREEAHDYGSGVQCTKCNHQCTHQFNNENSKCIYCGGVCGHSFDKKVIMEPGCDWQGLAFYDCKVCGYGYEKVLPSKGHDFTYTLTNYGSQHIGDCKNYDRTIQESHQYTDTCQCVCGYISQDALVHTYESVVTPPTCTEEGYTTHTCTLCEKVTVGDEVDSLGHKGGKMTCTKRAICETCGEHYGEEPEGHSWAPDDDTYLTPVLCPDCGDVITPAREEHEWDEYNLCIHCYTGKPFVFTFMDGDKEVFKADVRANDSYYFDVLEDRDSLTFLGWDADGDGIADYAGINLDSMIYVEGDMTFRAVYGDIIVVRYFGVNQDTGEYELVNISECAEGDSLFLQYDYAYWYKALGWATEPDGEVVYEYGEKITVNESVNLYTVWRPFEATFVLDDDVTWLDENGDPVPNTITKETEFYTFPTKPGYQFMGFTGRNTYGEFLFEISEHWETGELFISVYFSEDMTVTAIWEECIEHSFVNGKCEYCQTIDTTVFAITDYVGKTASVIAPQAGTYTVIFADYEEKRLANVEYTTITFTEETKGTVLTASITKDFSLGKDDKIMLWSGTTNLIPKCEAFLVK